MNEKQIILVPTDFSPIADNALDHAIHYAQKMHAKLLLLHVKHPMIIPPSDLPYPVKEEIITGYLELIPKRLEELREYVESKGVECEVAKELGLLLDEIKDYCEKRNPILLITGTKNHHHLAKKIFGSNSIDMAIELKTPVLIIPELCKYKKPSKILYATEYNEFDIHHIDYLKTWCNDDTQLYVAHVNTDATEYYVKEEQKIWFEQLLENKTGNKTYYFVTIHNQDVTEGLLSYIKKINIDLLCMSTERKSFWQTLFQKRHTVDVASKIEIPLLIFDNTWKISLPQSQ
jgi:nucleotide-binding universal stress UspA family protein